MVELGEDKLAQSAIVFSPHPDDETLGCGATITKKIRAGAKVKIVFMTDGRKSHSHLISENELKSIRATEALTVSRMMGVKEDDVIFLDFEDGKLSENQNSAIQKVLKILLTCQPCEVFIPYHKEPLMWSADHLATNRIVLAALQAYRKKVVIYEYPVWFWFHWPWVSLPTANIRKLLVFLKQGLFSPLSLLSDFRCSVYIGDVLEHKRTVLNHYKSQMTRLIPDPEWQTIADVSNGEFLECFFQEYEFFHCFHTC